ncbi:MAG: V4R domain-containing protein, partial [Candidatus Bathyarchaeia archaeon]
RFFLGHKYMLEFMHSTFEGVMGPAAKAVLYRYGEAVGFYLAKGFREKWGLKKEELVDFMFKAFTIWGFGKFSGVVYDLKRRFLKAAVQGSVEVSTFSKTEKPSCYFMAGLFGGLGKYLFGEEVICRENICEAAGDVACEFEVEPYFK